MNFFLGTNGPNGFFSYLEDLIEYKTAREVHFIKGLPGGGKSTFIRKIGAALEASGGGPEYFYCSSDPDSLDGVAFPQRGIAVFDGTAPHVMEPVYPGAVDHYIDLERLKDRPGLAAKRPVLEALLAASKFCFTLATPCVHAASLLEDTAYKRVISPALAEKIRARGVSLARREIPKTKRAPVKPVKRFLSAVTPMGLVSRYETVTENFERVVAINDNYGLGGLMTEELAGYAASQGYAAYACYHPLHPDTQIEHVLIPELKLAFVTQTRKRPYPAKPTRHVRLDSCVPAELIKERRSGLRFCAKTRDSCLAEACGHLRDAKLAHDQIEALIRPHMDFEAIQTLAEEKIRELEK